jgi:hypothetical protein
MSIAPNFINRSIVGKNTELNEGKYQSLKTKLEKIKLRCTATFQCPQTTI